MPPAALLVASAHPEMDYAREEVAPASGARPPLELVLGGGVPCAGRVELPEWAPGGDVRLRITHSPSQILYDIVATEPGRAFRIPRMMPGTYAAAAIVDADRATLATLPAQHFSPQRFVAEPGGAQERILRMEPVD